MTGMMLSGCVSFQFSKPLKTSQIETAEIKGTVTLILYGKRFLDDIETFALLDIDGDRYTFEPFAPEFDYRIYKGMGLREALSAASEFVSFHHSFWRSQLSGILDSNDTVIGYELRPLYHPYEFGKSDVLDIYYGLQKDGKVKVKIMLTVEPFRMDPPFGDDIAPPGGD
jgi:hypothetical protein